MAERGARMDESIAAMRVLWDEAAPQFEGRFVSFANVFQRPLPAQRPHPPLVIGGESPAAFRRGGPRARGTGGSQPEQIAGVRASLGEDVEITLTPGPPGPLDPRSRGSSPRPASRGSCCSRRTRRSRRWTS